MTGFESPGLLAPPAAFLAYLILVGILTAGGRWLAGPARETRLGSNTYSSGEAPPLSAAAPGYRPFFVVALFFAIVHLGVLMLGSSELLPAARIYLVGIILALMALLLG
jgi:NADH:ubiquinone oxidoreductase subunit 3 (subunit A)